jgi:hypothetical protein
MRKKLSNNKFKHLKLELLSLVILFIVFLIVFFYLSSNLLVNKIHYTQKSELLNFNINKAEKEYKNITIDVDSYNKANLLWQKISLSDQSKTGLEIENLKILIQDLKNLYKISDNIKVFVHSYKEMPNIVFHNNKILVNAQVNIECEAYDDEYFLHFIDAIKNNFPGFFKFTSFKMNKVLPLTQEIINDAQKGELQYLVKGEVSFDWYDFKSIN